MQLDSTPRFIACGPESMWKLLQVEIGGTRRELKDLLEIYRAEIRAVRRMVSAVIKLFQIEPPIPPVAIELINEIGELSCGLGGSYYMEAQPHSSKEYKICMPCAYINVVFRSLPCKVVSFVKQFL
jgi:hypothetical protein